MTTRRLPPLSLYIHIPWCIRKCPYCDFNSHAVKGEIPEDDYINALIDDFMVDREGIQQRPLQSIFFGGGTPSLFSAKSLDRLLLTLSKHIHFADDIEITLEANPGTVEAGRFRDYRTIGINRLSLGIQSFDNQQLKNLGRIHDSLAAEKAIETAENSGFTNFNLDLMYGLPEQSVKSALSDLERALAWKPKHLSWYQLTIEPNTVFYKRPPPTPCDGLIADMEMACRETLAGHGLDRYETSAYSQPNFPARHNMNYWLFGDYLGIGAGAHGKITTPTEIVRTQKMRQPSDFLDRTKPFLSQKTVIVEKERPFEFMINATRLMTAISFDLYHERTGLDLDSILPKLTRGQELGLVDIHDSSFQVTHRGRDFLNDLQSLFLTD